MAGAILVFIIVFSVLIIVIQIGELTLRQKSDQTLPVRNSARDNLALMSCRVFQGPVEKVQRACSAVGVSSCLSSVMRAGYVR